jgi:hypothetical protein
MRGNRHWFSGKLRCVSGSDIVLERFQLFAEEESNTPYAVVGRLFNKVSAGVKHEHLGKKVFLF